jgi:DNA-binding transcriptional LysR family regulator
MDLDVRRLRVLREVALRGTVTAAAESLGFTPSAISQQLSALERESGTALLERPGRRVSLTEAGQALVRSTEPVLAALEEAQAALERSRETVSGQLRVAASGSVARSLVIPVAARLNASHPRLRVSVQECGQEGTRELRLGRLDVVVTHEYTRDRRGQEPELARVGLFTEDMLAAAPAGLLARPVRLADLAGQVWAAEPPESTCGRAVRAACQAAGFEPDIRYVSSEPSVLLSAVRTAGAVALLPGLALVQPPPGVDIQPVSDPAVQRRVFAACRRGSVRRPAIALLLDQLQAAGQTTAAAARPAGASPPDEAGARLVNAPAAGPGQASESVVRGGRPSGGAAPR